LNILSSPQTHMQVKGATPSTDVLDMLGTQLVLDPEALKLLKENGSLEGMDFEALLKESEGKGETLQDLFSNNTETKNTKQNPQNIEKLMQQNPELIQNPELNPKLVEGEATQQIKVTPVEAGTGKSELQNILNPGAKSNSLPAEAIAKANQGETPVARILKIGESRNIKATQNNPNGEIAELATTNTKVENSKMAMVKNSEVTSQQSGTKAAQGKSNLLNLSDFIGKQSGSTQKRVGTKSYKPMTKSMFNQKVEAATPSVVKAQPQTQVTSLQDVIFGKTADQSHEGSDAAFNQNQQPQVNSIAKNANANVAKVFDMSSMQSNMTTDEVITKIQDYIVQNKFSTEKQVDFSFQNKELGQIDLKLHQAGKDQVNITIATSSAEGAKFFTQNKGELMQNLLTAGVQVGDLKLEAGSKAGSQESSQDSSRQFSQSNQKEHGSASNQRREEQEKRQALWEQLNSDKEVA
jgi:hypothetical protein